jgi:hypothetical protein
MMRTHGFFVAHKLLIKGSVYGLNRRSKSGFDLVAAGPKFVRQYQKSWREQEGSSL